MSGGSGGPVIIGNEPIIDQIEKYIDLVAPFRKNRAQALIALYHTNEKLITSSDQVFLFLCAIDIAQN